MSHSAETKRHVSKRKRDKTPTRWSSRISTRNKRARTQSSHPTDLSQDTKHATQTRRGSGRRGTTRRSSDKKSRSTTPMPSCDSCHGVFYTATRQHPQSETIVRRTHHCPATLGVVKSVRCTACDTESSCSACSNMVCDDCTSPDCSHCDNKVCIECVSECDDCLDKLCVGCRIVCCKNTVSAHNACRFDAEKCAGCDADICDDHGSECMMCDRRTCETCETTCIMCFGCDTIVCDAMTHVNINECSMCFVDVCVSTTVEGLRLRCGRTCNVCRDIVCTDCQSVHADGHRGVVSDSESGSGSESASESTSESTDE